MYLYTYKFVKMQNVFHISHIFPLTIYFYHIAVDKYYFTYFPHS